MELRADQALERLLQVEGIVYVLDIGSGEGRHAQLMRDAGKQVRTIALNEGADVVGDFMTWEPDVLTYDAVWASHVLEHQVDPGAFLRKCHQVLRPGGYLAVTVPPAKHEIVGGHVSLWNAGLLLYQLILAGFDCSEARVGTYGYNISVIVQKGDPLVLPELDLDAGDVHRLAKFFPCDVREGFDGRLPDVGWLAIPERVACKGPARTVVPERVAIVALGPSSAQFLEIAKRNGGRKAICDEVWGINAIGDVIACDAIFHMDDVRVQEARAARDPASNIAQMVKWLKTHKGPIYTSIAHPDYPGLIEYPLAEVLTAFPKGYFNSTVAYAVALAVCIGVKKILCFGMDFTYPNAHDAEKGRACVEFWLGIAAARGIEIALPRNTALMDALAPQAERFYGYDCVDLAFTNQGGQISVAMTPKAVPDAAEVEKRYDHNRHPNALVEAAQ